MILYACSSTTYPIPAATDSEGHSITLSYSSLPAFMSWDSANRQFNIAPTSPSHLGNFSISVSVSDSNKASSYPFTVDVLNRIPVFDGTFTTSISLAVGSS